jgi:murein L,D-transpeptidase YcbB/YkuD
METDKIWELAWTDRWVLKLGDKGITVALWQRFLIDKNFMDRHTLKFGFDDRSMSDSIGVFDKNTENLTVKYQKSRGLVSDGIVGRNTYAKAVTEGFDGISMEMAIVFAFNRINHNPNADSKLEIVFSSENGTLFKGISGVPEVHLSSDRELDANEALREFRNTF